jgi:hypothetical protein
MPRPAFTKGRFAAPWRRSVGPYLAERSHKRLYHSPQPGISARDVPGAGNARPRVHAQGSDPSRREPAATGRAYPGTRLERG